jgi:hypothetical protein
MRQDEMNRLNKTLIQMAGTDKIQKVVEVGKGYSITLKMTDEMSEFYDLYLRRYENEHGEILVSDPKIKSKQVSRRQTRRHPSPSWKKPGSHSSTRHSRH